MKVNDRVTVKTDGGPRRPGVVLAIEEFSEGTMYLVSLEDYPLGIWFFNELGASGRDFCRESRLARRRVAHCVPDTRCKSKNLWPGQRSKVGCTGSFLKRLTHVDENPVRHIIGQAYHVVDHLLIMRFNFPFNISFV